MSSHRKRKKAREYDPQIIEFHALENVVPDLPVHINLELQRSLEDSMRLGRIAAFDSERRLRVPLTNANTDAPWHKALDYIAEFTEISGSGISYGEYTISMGSIIRFFCTKDMRSCTRELLPELCRQYVTRAEHPEVDERTGDERVMEILRKRTGFVLEMMEIYLQMAKNNPQYLINLRAKEDAMRGVMSGFTAALTTEEQITAIRNDVSIMYSKMARDLRIESQALYSCIMNGHIEIFGMLVGDVPDTLMYMWMALAITVDSPEFVSFLSFYFFHGLLPITLDLSSGNIWTRPYAWGNLRFVPSITLAIRCSASKVISKWTEAIASDWDGGVDPWTNPSAVDLFYIDPESGIAKPTIKNYFAEAFYKAESLCLPSTLKNLTVVYSATQDNEKLLVLYRLIRKELYNAFASIHTPPTSFAAIYLNRFWDMTWTAPFVPIDMATLSNKEFYQQTFSDINVPIDLMSLDDSDEKRRAQARTQLFV